MLMAPNTVPVITASDIRVDNPAQTNTVFGCIQYGVDFATSGNTLNASTGTFVENVLVHTPVTINGNGQANTFVRPVFYFNAYPTRAKLDRGRSNVILVDAINVKIQNLTVDGDNTAITSGVVVGGADIDARAGIITNHDHTPFTPFNGLDVNNVTVRNTYFRGIYSSTDNTFSLNNNTVSNVAGEPGSVAILNFGGSGTFNGNTITTSNDGIASNYSTVLNMQITI